MNKTAKLIFTAAAILSLLCSCNGNQPVNPSESTSSGTTQSGTEATEDIEVPEGVSYCQVYLDRRAGTADEELLEEITYNYLGELDYNAIIATAASALEVTFTMNSIEERDGAIYIDWPLDSLENALCAEPLDENERLSDKLWTVLDSIYLSLSENFDAEVYYSFDGDSLIEASDKLVFTDSILSDVPFRGSQYYASFFDKTVLFEDIQWIAAELENEESKVFSRDMIEAAEFIDLNFDGRAELILTAPADENGVSVMSVYTISGGKAARLGEFRGVNSDVFGTKLVCANDGEYFYYNTYEALTTPYSNIAISNRLQVNGKRLSVKEMFSREGMFPIEIDNPKPEDMIYLYYKNGKSQSEEEYTAAIKEFSQAHTEIIFSSGKTEFDADDPLATLTAAAEGCTLMKPRLLHRPTDEELAAQTTSAKPAVRTTAQQVITETTGAEQQTEAMPETTTETAAPVTEETTSETEAKTTSDVQTGDSSETEATTTALPVIKRDEFNRPYTENTDETRRVL